MRDKIELKGESYFHLANGFYKKDNQLYLFVGNSYKDKKKTQF